MLPHKPKVLLQRWARANFSPPPHDKTLLRWTARGWIEPAPEKVGKRWYVDAGARFVGERSQSTGSVHD